jgi:phosphoribosyl 1,2-cyclic phosphate phosphodiesterase
MIRKLELTLLGTGSSGGVPRIGNDWGKCDSKNSKNRRRRCALLVEKIDSSQKRTTVLIDAGVDMREQLLSTDVKSLDAVLLTHSHADHIFGLDDLRQMAITLRRSIDVHMDAATSDVLMKSFSYCFHQAPGSSYPAFCNEHRITHKSLVNIEGAGGSIGFKTLLAEHGDINALGFRIGDAVYLPDIKRISDNASLEVLENTGILIIDALRRKSHPSHMNMSESLEFIDQIRPKRAILTNMHSDLDYEALRHSLPPDVEPGFDGMKIECPLS